MLNHAFADHLQVPKAGFDTFNNESSLNRVLSPGTGKQPSH